MKKKEEKKWMGVVSNDGVELCLPCRRWSTDGQAPPLAPPVPSESEEEGQGATDTSHGACRKSNHSLGWLSSRRMCRSFCFVLFSFRFTFVVQVDWLLLAHPQESEKNNLLFSLSYLDRVELFCFNRLSSSSSSSSYRTNTNMFGGLPTPTETDAPDNVLTTGTSTAASDYQHPDCDGSPSHDGHLTTSHSAHITLRYVASFSFAFDPCSLKQLDGLLVFQQQ